MSDGSSKKPDESGDEPEVDVFHENAKLESRRLALEIDNLRDDIERRIEEGSFETEIIHPGVIYNHLDDDTMFLPQEDIIVFHNNAFNLSGPGTKNVDIFLNDYELWITVHGEEETMQAAEKLVKDDRERYEPIFSTHMTFSLTGEYAKTASVPTKLAGKRLDRDHPLDDTPAKTVNSEITPGNFELAGRVLQAARHRVSHPIKKGVRPDVTGPKN